MYTSGTIEAGTSRNGGNMSSSGGDILEPCQYTEQFGKRKGTYGSSSKTLMGIFESTRYPLFALAIASGEGMAGSLMFP